MEGFFSFLESNSIYIVLFIVLIVWAGIYLFMVNANNRLKAIEKELNGSKQDEE